MDKENLSKSQYLFGQMPQAWLRLAFQYKLAGDAAKEALQREIGSLAATADAHQPIWLLYGYAFELFAKAYRLMSNPSLAQDDKLHRDLSFHNPLVDFEKCGLVFDESEKRLLRKLAYAVEKGRYPVPKKHEDTIWMKNDEEFGMRNGVLPDHMLSMDGDYEGLITLWDKVVHSYDGAYPSSYGFGQTSVNMQTYYGRRSLFFAGEVSAVNSISLMQRLWLWLRQLLTRIARMTFGAK
ncbi:hypothetical protein [Azospirillum canadense]|uniref:hypothetical protein n=1 Tax=Azospirillum canadense TaxID=403962 RepID=UPI002227CDF6|nr:hypothetical protein [Azospirillum canadense]MCW2242298.1 hypothetical protein [Azospirillum canadense]